MAGTPVNAENGKVPIEIIKPGDIVLSEDPETGDVEYKRVLEAYINESAELVHLIIDDEEIITTPSHPHYFHCEIKREMGMRIFPISRFAMLK